MTQFSSQNKMPYPVTQSSDKEIGKSASGPIKLVKFSISESTNLKLKNQFHSKRNNKNSNAKDLILKKRKKFNKYINGSKFSFSHFLQTISHYIL